MATLYVRDVPEEVYRALVNRARERDTSIAAEMIRLLQSSIPLDRPDQAALIESIRQDRRPMPLDGPSAVELIRENRGR